MSITITDPSLATALAAASGTVQLTLPDGTVLGVFDAEPIGVPPPGTTSPVSAEDMAERRKQRTGRKLDDILRDLEARG